MWISGFKDLQFFHHHEGHQGPPHTAGRHAGALESRRSGSREIKVVRRVLDANDIMAARNRDLFAAKGIFVLNMMSSPGSGKTTYIN